MAINKILTALNRKEICCVCKQPIYKYQEHFTEADEGYKDRQRWHKKCDQNKIEGEANEIR